MEYLTHFSKFIMFPFFNIYSFEKNEYLIDISIGTIKDLEC